MSNDSQPDHPDASQVSADGARNSSAKGDEDLVDEETKQRSQDEAAQHDSVEEAQSTDARESGGYGH